LPNGRRFEAEDKLAGLNWHDLKLVKAFRVQLDSDDNIFVMTEGHLILLRVRDKTAHIVFGQQTPQECASGLIQGTTKEEDFSESFRSGFAAFCPGDVMSSFAVKDECKSKGIYRIGVASGYPVGNGSVLVAERGC